MTPRVRSLVLDSLLISTVLSALFFILLGSRPLFVPDEGRYAEIAREMIAGGDFITPHLNGIKYFEKPVLFYWLCSAAIKLFGLNLWAVRGVNALLSLFGCLATYFTVRRLFDRSSGLLASLILGTSFLYAAMTRMITLDLPVTFFLTLSLYAFLLAVYEDKAPGIRKYLCWAAFAMSGLAVLTKGLIGIVFPCLIVGSWIVLFNQWRLLKELYIPSSLVVFFIIVLPWHLLAQWYNPEFFDFYVIEQHILRYVSPEVGHYQPVWFFVPCILLGFFPWLVFLPQMLYRYVSRYAIEDYSKEAFFLLWTVIIFLFFSFSKSKLIPYILPIFPPLAVMCSRYLSTTINSLQLSHKISHFFAIIMAFAIAILFTWFSNNSALPNPYMAKFYLQFAAWSVIVGSCIAFWCVFIKPKWAIVAMMIYSSLFTLLIFTAMPSVDNRSIYPLAQILINRLNDRDEVITYDRYYQDLPFYLQRKVSILNWRNELTFGMQHQKNHAWLLNETDFWKKWRGPNRAYVIMSIEDYKNILTFFPNDRFLLLGRTNDNILASNRP